MLQNKKVLTLKAIALIFFGLVCTLGLYWISVEKQDAPGNASQLKTNKPDPSSTAIERLFQGKNAQAEKASDSMAAIQNAIQTNILEMEKNQPWNLAELNKIQVMSLLAMEKKALASHNRAEQALKNADKEDMLREIKVLKSISMQRIALLSANLNTRN